MATLAQSLAPQLREALLDRRQKLEVALPQTEDAEDLRLLLSEVDAALARMDDGSYGLCEVCHDPVEPERLLADPLTCLCLDHLTPTQQRALEEDLGLASQIQRRLLPEPLLRTEGWEASHRYVSAGIVGGDYCDVILAPDGTLHFALGDVSGKGVAASMLMSNLQATFRTLTSLGLEVAQVVERANRIFCDSTLPAQYATLVFGRAASSGEVTLCNAGHLPPIMISGGKSRFIQGAGLPLGLFCQAAYRSHTFRMGRGDALLLYTDGLPESLDGTGNEYGRTRLCDLLAERRPNSAEELLEACLSDLASFRGGARQGDDLALLAMLRTGESSV